MSPRTGRPKMDNPKNHDIKVRIDEETHAKVLQYAKKHGLSRTEVFRRGLELLLAQEN